MASGAATTAGSAFGRGASDANPSMDTSAAAAPQKRTADGDPTPPGSPGPKRATRREKVQPPSVVPDVPHMQVVQEIQRMVLQEEADARYFDNTYDQINDHADKLQKLKEAMTRQITKVNQLAADVTKVAADVLQNDTNLKTTLTENDANTKTIIQNNDAELKLKLKALEAIVVDQGRRLSQVETVGSGSAASGVPVGATPVGAATTGTTEVMAVKEEVAAIKGTLAALESRADTALKGLESVINQIRSEVIPGQINEVMTQMTNMASRFSDRMDKLEVEGQMLREQQSRSQHSSAGAGPAPRREGEQTANQPWGFGAGASGNTDGHGRGAFGGEPAHTRHHWASDPSKTLFEDTIAVTEVMRYPAEGAGDRDRERAVERKLAWVKTTRNYFISKAPDMEFLLLWAEDFQSRPATNQHTSSMADSGQCMDHDQLKLSRDLWGHLNLVLPVTSADRTAFDLAPPGNGLDAWRRIVDPLGPRSKERLFNMHTDVINPKTARSVSSVLHEIEEWENELREY